MEARSVAAIAAMSLVATLGLFRRVWGLKVRFLAIVPEAFGGFGGIAVYNCDLLTALADLQLCEKVTVLPRLIRQAPTMLPPQVEVLEKAATSKMRYVRELARILIKRERYDVVLCGHINLLPLAVIASRLLGAKHVLLIYGIDAWIPTGRWLERPFGGIHGFGHLDQSTSQTASSCLGVAFTITKSSCCRMRFI